MTRTQGFRPTAARLLRGHGLLVGLCLAGAALRFATLGQQSFWLDEAVTGRLMRLDLPAMLRAIPRSESTPPLYYIVAWLWTRVFGVSEVGLRSLSAALGTLTIPLVHAAGARLAGRRTGLAAAGLATFAPLLVWYSQEARSYALLVACCAAGLWAFAGALEDRAHRWLWLWALCSALGLATHYFAVFLVGPELCVLLYRRGRPALPALACVIAAGLALSPLALHQRANGSAGFIGRTPLLTRFAAAVKQLAVGYDAPYDTLVVALAAALGLLVAGLAVRRAAGRPPAVAGRLGCLAVATAVLPVALGLLGYDYVITRNLIVVWVPGALALAAVLAGAGRAGTAALAAICALGLAVTIGIDVNQHFQRDDWRDAVRLVPSGALSALVVTPASGRIALDYYLPSARPLPAAGATVADIEVIALGVRAVGDAVQAPQVRLLPTPPTGFRPPQVSRHATFTVVRYRAIDATALVTSATLTALQPAPDGTTQLIASGP